MTDTVLRSEAQSNLRRGRKRRVWSKYAWGLAFIAPALVIFVLFLWVPIVKGFVYSFYQVDFVHGNTFVGLDNYRTVFQDAEVGTAVKNTLYYMVLALFMGFWVPCVFAIAISELKFMQGFVRVSAYLPNVIPAVVLYGLWRWMYDPVGPINASLTQSGFDMIAFLTDKSWSMISLVVMETWQQFGAAMLIYLAGVLSIPRDWYEAAEIDGAGVWQRIRYITLPSIKNLMALMLVLQLIATSQGYLSQYAMLGGGPNNATLTYGLLIIKYAFTRIDFGVASALGVLMFIALSLLAFINFKLDRKEAK